MNKLQNKINPIAMYDLTVPYNDFYGIDSVKEFCRKFCKRWCFQEERGESGYHHLQCRISLTTKKRVDSMIKWISTDYPGWHVSATSNTTYYTGDMFYVMKEDTRINGPWDDKTDVDPSKIPSRFRGIIVWRPWQNKVLEYINQTADDRSVDILVDKDGNNGKSFLTLYLGATGRARRVPQQKEARDIMRLVMDTPKVDTYFIDLPRATSHKDQHSIFSAIEEIKNGYAYDDRYHFKEAYFEPPHVWVFTNEKPPTNLLSSGRWRFWIIQNNDLVRLLPSVALDIL